jgi:hypothetical protein
MNQGIWAASRTRKSKEMDSPPETPERNVGLTILYLNETSVSGF